MKNLWILVAVFPLFSGCDIPKRPVSEGNVKGSFFAELFGSRCSVEILFGSYAGGIDIQSHAEITSLLTRRDDLLRNEEQIWGGEGEKAICVNMRSAAGANALARDIDKIITAHTPTKGPVTVTRGPPLGSGLIQ